MNIFLALVGCHSQLSTPSFESEMIYFEPSIFDMGYPDVEVGPYGNHWKETAQPQHQVTLSGFWLDKTEVTVAQYAEFLTAIESDRAGSALPHFHSLQPITWDQGSFVPTSPSHDIPIHYVSFYDALSYCAWRGSSLPTEAMWERAAKGSDRDNPRAFPWADGGANCQKAVYYTNNTLCHSHPQPVGSHPLGSTPEGLQDMAGNVSEWVWDWFARYEDTSVEEPLGPDLGTYKVVRGGGFRETADALRSTDRVLANPLSRSEGIGFRCGHGDSQ